jgi:hypothetical protein
MESDHLSMRSRNLFGNWAESESSAERARGTSMVWSLPKAFDANKPIERFFGGIECDTETRLFAPR